MKLKRLASLLNPRYLRHWRTGFCPVCARHTVFCFIDGIERVRNHARCLRCRSISRNRQVALCAIEAHRGDGVAALADFRRATNLTVMNASSATPIARALGLAPHIHNTEYFEGCPSGSVKDGVTCQDFENLSFDSGSLDLILSEDVFEHVQDVRRGLSEVSRVLKPGGRHIFTIPFCFAERTRHLFEKRGEEYVPVVLPVEYHGDGIRDRIPAYHHLGYDLFDWLAELGMETRVRFTDYAECRKYGTYDCYTFISRKI